MSTQEAPVINRVAKSGLVTVNLEDFRPTGERALIDIKDQLYKELMFKEQDFRDWIDSVDWTQYEGQKVAVTCSTDAIVPAWPFMLIATKLSGIADYVMFGTLEELEVELIKRELDQHDWSQYAGGKIVIKGCGNITEPLYVDVTRRLMPHVAKLMYGEPCSMVPLFKDLSRAKK